MPRIGNIHWSPKDTKAQLVNKADKAGLFISSSLLKADIVSLMLGNSDLPVNQATLDPVPGISKEDHILLGPGLGRSAMKIESTLEPTDNMSEYTSVDVTLDFIGLTGKRVSYDSIIENCGPTAKDDTKELVKSKKIIQYKKHNSFSYKVNS